MHTNRKNSCVIEANPLLFYAILMYRDLLTSSMGWKSGGERKLSFQEGCFIHWLLHLNCPVYFQSHINLGWSHWGGLQLVRGGKKKAVINALFFFSLSLPSFPASIHQLLQKRGRLNWKLLKIRWTSLHCTVHMFACSLTTPFPNLAAQLAERLKLRGVSLTSLTAA